MPSLLTQTLAEKYPNSAHAIAEIAGLTASLELPRPTVHVISDVHGEHKKLRHVINNASGSLRPLVRRLFDGTLPPGDQAALLRLIYYPREFLEQQRTRFGSPEERHAWVLGTLENLFTIIRNLAGAYRGRVWERLTERPYREVFRELFNAPTYRRPERYLATMLQALESHEQDLAAVRHACRLVRNLSVAEIVVAGDLGDRGPRIDRVIDLLMQQPNVNLVWGNHDISWLGACIGQDALIATVLRISLRYLRLWQLEEGYGISLAPLEKLVRQHYPEPAPEPFRSKRGGTTRPDELVARMHLAAAVLQFKLEAQAIRRNPGWHMDDRVVLDRIDFARGVLQPARTGEPEWALDGLPVHVFPAGGQGQPWDLLPAEQECLDRLRLGFTSSNALWDHMRWVVENGTMALTRDHCAIFHACLPTGDDDRFLETEIDGDRFAGKAAFDAYEAVVRRAYQRGGKTATPQDKDLFYYLWAGPRSPLFGKDRMATFETYFVDDPAARHEDKNPYFKRIHDRAFAARACAEFGLGEGALLVNGHIPVRPERGESPVKQGGNAVTIDGAFSEAYGDRGYTLILAPEGVFLAEHHHFETIQEAVEEGADIIPETTTLREYGNSPRRVADTPEAAVALGRVGALEELVAAYRSGALHERAAGRGTAPGARPAY